MSDLSPLASRLKLWLHAHVKGTCYRNSLLISASSCSVPMWWRKRGLCFLSCFLHGHLILPHWSFPLHPPKPSSANTITLGIRTSTYEFDLDKFPIEIPSYKCKLSELSPVDVRILWHTCKHWEEVRCVHSVQTLHLDTGADAEKPNHSWGIKSDTAFGQKTVPLHFPRRTTSYKEEIKL